MVLIHDSFCWFVSKWGRDVRKMPFNFLKATVVLCLNPEMIPTISGSHLFLLWVKLIEDYFILVSLVNFFFFFFFCFWISCWLHYASLRSSEFYLPVLWCTITWNWQTSRFLAQVHRSYFQNVLFSKFILAREAFLPWP